MVIHMDVNALKKVTANPDYGISGVAAEKPRFTPAETAKAKQADSVKQEKTGDEGMSLTHEEVRELTEALNKFMTSMNADLQFALHEKTKSLMVQLIDPKNQQVIKEFPQHEFLDMVARISEYVGALLDKKV